MLRAAVHLIPDHRSIRLQVKHAGYHLQTILDPMVDFFEQDLMAIERGLQLALILLLFDRHAKDVCRALQERDVVLAKFAFGSAVYFEHTEWRAIALQYDVHCTANAVFDKQFRSSKSLLVFEVVGDNGLAGAQGIARGRGQIGPDGCGRPRLHPSQLPHEPEAGFRMECIPSLCSIPPRALQLSSAV